MNVERSRRLLSTHAWVTTLGGAFLLAACSEPAPRSDAPATPDRPSASAPVIDWTSVMTAGGGYYLDDMTFVVNPNMVPATRSKRPQPLKADSLSDARFLAPQNYAITEPPKDIAHIRPMVEWEPMKAIVMGFPSSSLDDNNATQTVVTITKHASAVGEVWILANSNNVTNSLKAQLLQAGVAQDLFDTKIKFFRAALDSIWFIDYGPLPIVNTADNSYAFGDFRYYYERAEDDAIPSILARNLVTGFGQPNNTVTYRMPLTVEGGTFQSTTDGVCITGSREIQNLWCYEHGQEPWCDDNITSMALGTIEATPEAQEMFDVVSTYAGCKDLIVTNSITDDGTGHIDMYLKILDDRRILVGDYRPPFAAYEQENAALLDANAAYLESYVKADGTHFEVSRITMAGHRNGGRGIGSVPFTYINSTFFNGLNLWPATNFADGVTSRNSAQATWDEVLPDMENIWIDATSLSFGSGAIHCITRTIPAKAPGLWVADGTCGGASCTAPPDGYDGACNPPGASTDICYGPAWACGCNDCTNGCTDPCHDISDAGCCDGGNVVACVNGVPQTYDCQGTGCGWEPSQGGYYNCQRQGEDPSGFYPRECSCTADCSDKECGSDGCGGSCGTCAAGVACLGSQCRVDCALCTPGELGCDGTVAWLCEAGSGGCNTKRRVDCATMGGRTCQAGDCIDDGVEHTPEAGPEAEAEAAPELATEPTQGAETSGTDTSISLDVTGGDTGHVASGSKGGCESGGSSAGGAVIAVACGLMMRRRRAGR